MGLPNQLSLGIHVHAEPERLRATLASVQANMLPSTELLLLPDGPDEATRRALTLMTDLRQLPTAEALGAAACFNRLVIGSKADTYILLESGSVVAPRWLEYLLAAVQADPQNGLAGPSTNRAWNAQCVFPRAGGEPQAIERAAQEAAVRFGDTWRSLAPLHSLADFCYVVRREVVEAIGAADEGYGLGPCWEMDYNIRAARAGWRGVWACGAYVYRAPFTARRQREERQRFEASKRRYQDRFCALRLLGHKADYEAHCRGDDCEHFAPRELIVIRQPLLPALNPAEQTVALGLAADVGRVNKGVGGSSRPLVSCIMPTYNRRAFVPRAIACFLRQDYAQKELIILDDGTDAIGDLVPPDDRIRYVRLDRRLTVGAKRNQACELARGEVIAHWDDDDWNAPNRLTYQVEALLREQAVVCGINRLLFYDAARRRAWLYTYPADQRFWLAGSSLCYWRSFWAEQRFADVNVGEDARFVWSAPQARMAVLSDHHFHVGLIHADNASPKRLDGTYWRELDATVVERLFGDDVVCSPIQPDDAVRDWPLISAIMPTFNRRPFVPLAIQSFLAQEYPHKELLIVDDGDDPIEDLIKHLPGIHYLRLKQRTSIGAKRNLACHEAGGEIIVHWDDDDWYAPHRLRYQVEPILLGQADITGLENSYVLDLAARQFWTTSQQLHQRMFVGDVHGGTLVYSKSLKDSGLRYPEVNLAEDAALLKQALQRGRRLTRLPNTGVFIYMRHGHNAWKFQTGKFLDPAGWRRAESPATFPAGLVQAYEIASMALNKPQDPVTATNTEVITPVDE